MYWCSIPKAIHDNVRWTRCGLDLYIASITWEECFDKHGVWSGDETTHAGGSRVSKLLVICIVHVKESQPSLEAVDMTNVSIHQQ